ncbi:VOC family protein [Phenylobacterium sp.]|uniref:VOC family protein n=1 Tax=Phenylobacterium sp. TaxID=1871053 RepID=UPI0027325B1A|nr:VOC family protein [Phenylobacterium sp.]MDP3855008.1 VOC family protein [Phenylobacterium sp.]
MHIRTIYFKVMEIGPSRAFWAEFLAIAPHKDFEGWCEFMVGDVRLALLPLEKFEGGGGCVPVFELPDRDAVRDRAASAIGLGAQVHLDNLDDPDSSSIALLDPAGNQFELTNFHD